MLMRRCEQGVSETKGYCYCQRKGRDECACLDSVNDAVPGYNANRVLVSFGARVKHGGWSFCHGFKNEYKLVVSKG